MKTYISATYLGLEPSFTPGEHYAQLQVIHYFLGTKVRVSTCRGFGQGNSNQEIVYDNATEFARDWDIQAEYQELEHAPKQRKRRMEDD